MNWDEKIRKYLCNLYEEDIDWQLYKLQLDKIKKEYNISSKDFYLVLRYACELNDYRVNESYYLRQFCPFINLCLNFLKEIEGREKEVSLPPPTTQKPKSKVSRKWKEDLEGFLNE